MSVNQIETHLCCVMSREQMTVVAENIISCFLHAYIQTSLLLNSKQ